MGSKGILLPDSLVDFLGRKDTAPVPHQEIHDLRLRGGKLHRFSVCIEGALLHAVAEAAVVYLFFWKRKATRC